MIMKLCLLLLASLVATLPTLAETKPSAVEEKGRVQHSCRVEFNQLMWANEGTGPTGLKSFASQIVPMRVILFYEDVPFNEERSYSKKILFKDLKKSVNKSVKLVRLPHKEMVINGLPFFCASCKSKDDDKPFCVRRYIYTGEKGTLIITTYLFTPITKKVEGLVDNFFSSVKIVESDVV